MVKGISKQVIVVKAPIGSMFDEAIFILKEDSLSDSSVDSENILREACAVADDYVRTHCKDTRRHTKRRFPSFFLSFAVVAAVLASIAFFILR